MFTLQPDCDICVIPKEEFITPSEVNGELLYCTCPICNNKVGADIYNEQITCPACGAQAEWRQ